MKTERRHELQKNELADVLGKEITAMRPYWKLIIGGVVAVIAVGIALVAYSQSQKSAQQAAWKPFFAAQSKALVDRDSDALKSVAHETEGTPVSPIAELFAADRELAEGIRLLYVNRKEADDHITKAAEGYERAQQKASGTQVEFKVRALLGLASAQESLRNLDKAHDALEAAEKAAPNTALGKEATRRKELLTKNKEWYAWFKEQSPVSPHSIPPAGEKPLVDPAFKLKEVPDSPDISFPLPVEGKPGATKPGEKPLGPELPPVPSSATPSEPAKPDAGPVEKPAEGKAAEKAGEAKPAEDAKPASEAKPAAPEAPAKPVEEAKPAEKKPAEDAKPAK